MRDGACCDDTCCDARGVMHEYIMAIFLGKSGNQEVGGVCLMLSWVEISHCVWRMHSEGTGLVGRVVKGPFSLPPTWRAASTQVPPTYMEGPWTSERIISFYVAEKKKYFGTLANEVVW